MKTGFSIEDGTRAGLRDSLPPSSELKMDVPARTMKKGISENFPRERTWVRLASSVRMGASSSVPLMEALANLVAQLVTS